jgi:hypothetical protein
MALELRGGTRILHVWCWQHGAVRVSVNLSFTKTPYKGLVPVLLFKVHQVDTLSPLGSGVSNQLNENQVARHRSAHKQIRNIKSFKRFVIPVLKGVLPGLNPSGDSLQVAVERINL